MQHFLDKREVLNFSIAGGSHRTVSKRDFEVEKEKEKRGFLVWRTELPDGSLTFVRKGWLGSTRIFDEGKDFSCSVVTSCEYKGKKKHGEYKVVLSCGKGVAVEVEGMFRNGKAHGTFRLYNFGGRLLSSCVFVNGEILEYSLGPLQSSVISRNKKKETLHLLMRKETETPSVEQVEWFGYKDKREGLQCNLHFKIWWFTFKGGKGWKREFSKDKETTETKEKRNFFFGEYLKIEQKTWEGHL
ncbi:hypothetical protein A9K97_gp298 [Tokyovirus A1]|uniref:hypothetical protein n=1 Tax=Tokyovirus A1 TaxID=1826170 RepID=UPI0007A98C03|nr:hypothetical protein A9K97_gp298 [Tokyovirus A1]BAU80053.1 hypothetical protein [Tokyovirus A1]